jgi:hypothetical protein
MSTKHLIKLKNLSIYLNSHTSIASSLLKHLAPPTRNSTKLFRPVICGSFKLAFHSQGTSSNQQMAENVRIVCHL